MILISKAVNIIKSETLLLEAETVVLEKSIHRVLAEEIRADMDLPPFHRSQMDGFALRTKDVEAASKESPVNLKIVGESIAGKSFVGKIKKGETVKIMTGARLPNAADSVQKKELTREIYNEENESLVEIFAATKLNQNFVKRAAEVKKGKKLFSKGEIVTANMIASLAAFGYAKVRVFQKPKVAILATGSEIVNVSQKPKQDQIRNSNSVLLKVLAEKYAAKTKVLPIVKDEIENLKSKIRHSLKSCDVLIISGGVSVGDYDFTKPALRELKAEIFFEKVSLRPGKPTVFAKLDNKLIFGLPGNPVSAAVTFYLFVRMALLKMQNAKNYGLPEGFAIASEKIKGAKERDSFLPARIETNEKGQLITFPIKWGGSSDFIAFARADVLIFVPKGKTLEPGTIVKIAYLDN